MIRTTPKKGLKRSPLRTVSKKMARQKIQERKLSQELLIRSGGLCERCKQSPDWRGLAKHEIIFRSQGGNPLDKTNTVLLCGKCHSAMHGIYEVGR
jgi:5-methylcytosine-specific restriction endonuclease McrA